MASLFPLNPVYGAHVAPQRCPILRYGYKHYYDTIKFIPCQCTTSPTRVYSFRRRNCSTKRDEGVQPQTARVFNWGAIFMNVSFEATKDKRKRQKNI